MHPFLCHECGRVFASKFSLQRHRQNTHNKLHYACEICKKSYTRLAYLKNHECIHQTNNCKENISAIIMGTTSTRRGAPAQSSPSQSSSTFDTNEKWIPCNESGIAVPKAKHHRRSTDQSLLVPLDQHYEYASGYNSNISISNVGETASQEAPQSTWGFADEPINPTNSTSDHPALSSVIKTEIMYQEDLISSPEMSRCTEENTLPPTIPAPQELPATQQKEDDIDLFFKSIAISVKKLKPELIHEAKMSSLQMIFRLESRQRNSE